MKNGYWFLWISISLTILSCQSNNNEKEKAIVVNSKEMTIAFGSCNKLSVDGEMWPAVSQNDPDVFIWLGDIIYGDTHDMEVLKGKYDQLKELKEYKEFAQKTPVLGVWDDHDYGVNDGGKYYSKKVESKEVLLDFLAVPENAAVRKRAGVYSSKLIGADDQMVKIILLDGRSFRDTLVHSNTAGQRYEANPTGDILGEEQWKWLEDELVNSSAKVHVIGCGIQFLPEEHGWEKWANFPKSRQRLLDLLEKTQPKNPILISGDRHIAEVSKIRLPNLPKPLYEVTASGLTHTWSNGGSEPNKYRDGYLVINRNFGLINIKWDENKEAKISLQVKGLKNSLLLQRDLYR